MPLQERLDRHVEAEMRGLRPAERQRRHQRIDPALHPADPRAGRHLPPIELHHLPRPIPRPLRRRAPPAAATSAACDGPDQPTPDSRARPQQLGQPRRLDLRPLLAAPARSPASTDPAATPPAPAHTAAARPTANAPRPSADGSPAACDLPLRHTIPRQRPDLSPLQRAHHLSRPPLVDQPDEPEAGTGRHRSGAFWIPRSGALLGAWRQPPPASSG